MIFEPHQFSPMPKNIIISSAALLLSALIASAQVPNQQVDTVQQQQQLQQTANLAGQTNSPPELYSGETGDIGPQSVLRRHHRKFFEAYVDEQFFYTDNMFLTEHGKQGSDVLVSTLFAAFAPEPYKISGGTFTPRLGFQQQWYSYGNAGQIDFNAQTIYADGAWRRKNWFFTGDASYQRLLDSDGYGQFYTEAVPHWSVVRIFPLNEKIGISASYEGDYRFTTSSQTPPGLNRDMNDRTDHSVVLVANWQLCQHALVQPFYRFQFAHYTQLHRDDYINSLGVALYCPLNKFFTLRAFVNYNDVNTDGFFAQDYDSLNAGGGLNFTVRF